MSDQRAIMLSLIMNIDSLSNSRNEEEKILSIDITDNEDYNSSNIRLAPNNEEGTNSKSSKIIENVESFFYLYVPYDKNLVTFTNMDGTQFSISVVNIVMLCAAFKQIEIVNLNTTEALAIKTIYS